MAAVAPRIPPPALAASAASVLIAALLLAGCGGGGQGGSSQSGALAPSAPTSQAPPAHEEQKGGEASIEEFGVEAEGSEREEIVAVFGGYLNAIAEGDYAAACADLSASVQRSLARLAGQGSKQDCATILPKLLAPTAAAISRQEANGDLTKVRVQGERAFVVFKAPGAKLYQLTMVREGGSWKAATVAASVLVPEL